jgi:uncharacterized protein YlxW (UPF0749 family)
MKESEDARRLRKKYGDLEQALITVSVLSFIGSIPTCILFFRKPDFLKVIFSSGLIVATCVALWAIFSAKVKKADKKYDAWERISNSPDDSELSKMRKKYSTVRYEVETKEAELKELQWKKAQMACELEATVEKEIKIVEFNQKKK